MAGPCKKCGSQDVKWVEFRSKAGNDVKGWKCQEKQCGDLTFAGPPPKKATSSPELEKKIDKILAILEKNFGNVTVEKEETLPF